MNGESPPDDGVHVDLHAHLLEGSDFVIDDVLRQPELRDAVYEHPTRPVQGLKNVDLVAEPGDNLPPRSVLLDRSQ